MASCGCARSSPGGRARSTCGATLALVAALAIAGGCRPTLIEAPAKGTVRVESYPSGAQVIVDGEPRGQTPVTFSARERANGAEVTLRLDGFGEWRRRVAILPDASLVLRVPMQPLSGAEIVADGRLVVDTVPPAKLYLDGEETEARTPLDAMSALSVSLGRHVIDLETDEGLLYRYRVEVARPGLSTVTIAPLGGPAAGSATADLVKCWGCGERPSAPPLARRQPRADEVPATEQLEPVPPLADLETPTAASPTVADLEPAQPEPAGDGVEAPASAPAEEVAAAAAAEKVPAEPKRERRPRPARKVEQEEEEEEEAEEPVPKRPPELAINTTPDAMVVVDGKETGRRTPLWPGSGLRLSPGTHLLTFVTVAGRSYSYEVNIPKRSRGRLTLVCELGRPPRGTVEAKLVR